MKKPKTVAVKRCNCGNCVPRPDPRREELSKRMKEAREEVLKALNDTLVIVGQEGSPRLKAALKREALARFDWEQAHINYLTYKPVKAEPTGRSAESKTLSLGVYRRATTSPTQRSK
jgi:hypothetical protein